MPPTVPNPKHARVTRRLSSTLPLDVDLAIRFVAAIERNSRGREALSLMDEAGPNAANSTDDVRPTNAASIRDMRGGAA